MLWLELSEISKSKKSSKIFFVFIPVTGAWLIGIFVAYHFIVNPIVNFLWGNDGAKVLIACAMSWFLLSTLFQLIFERSQK